MATPSLTPLPVERIERLERQLAVTRLLILLSIGLNLLLVGIGLQHFGFHLASRTIEVRKIVLTDPAQHVLAVIGVDNNWDGLPSKTYYPGIEFQDEKGERKMVLFGTGVYFAEGNNSANFGFTGLDFNDKKNGTDILLNGSIFSYSTDKAQFILFHHPEGLDFTIGDGENNFGVNTGHNQVSMFVASPKGEFDITADETGARVQRSAKGQSSR
jgi:hypothetical protein